MNDLWRQANLANWNNRAALHAQDATGTYDIAGFLNGRDSLHAIEAEEIGDVSGKRLIHLQCHFGLDTLSLARRGADVTGVDFSPVAIASARDLAQRVGLAATFVETDVYETRNRLEGTFDIVYVTWGAINWLPDMNRWAQVVASLLKPGGFLYLAESHPSALVLDEREGRILPAFAWRTPPDKPLKTEDSISYTGDALPEDARTNFEWLHPLSDIIDGLMRAGLRLDVFHEHELLPYKLFPSMIPAGKLYRLPDTAVPIPLSFSLKAVKG